MIQDFHSGFFCGSDMLILLAEIIKMLQIGWRIPVIAGRNAVVMTILVRSLIFPKCGKFLCAVHKLDRSFALFASPLPAARIG